MSQEERRRLANAAQSIHHEIPLLVAHIFKFPKILGNMRWLSYDRYLYGRPKSELSPALFWKDHLIIAFQTLYTIPFVIIIIITILFCLQLYDLHAGAPLFFPYVLCLPFKACLRFLSWYLSLPKFDMRRDVTTRMKNVNENESWYLVNGIIESPAMVAATAEILHEWTGRAITPLVNPSHGIGVDLLECILGRTLDTKEAVVKGIVSEVCTQLFNGKKVVILGHSQGGIILSHVVKELVVDAENNPSLAQRLQHLEVYTFGSAADEFAGYEDNATGKVYPFAEHFGAEMDIVASIGALTYSGALPPPPGKAVKSYKDEAWNGKTYMLPKEEPCNGHLMKEHILPALRAGLFGKDSVFMTKYCNRKP